MGTIVARKRKDGSVGYTASIVRKKGGAYKIVDVVVEGVSMAVTQRSDFASVIQRGGGDLNVLLAHLKSLNEQGI